VERPDKAGFPPSYPDRAAGHSLPGSGRAARHCPPAPPLGQRLQVQGSAGTGSAGPVAERPLGGQRAL